MNSLGCGKKLKKFDVPVEVDNMTKCYVVCQQTSWVMENSVKHLVGGPELHVNHKLERCQ
jgi:hypothetical protein